MDEWLSGTKGVVMCGGWRLDFKEDFVMRCCMSVYSCMRCMDDLRSRITGESN
jgi:hypothetical protein